MDINKLTEDINEGLDTSGGNKITANRHKSLLIDKILPELDKDLSSLQDLKLSDSEPIYKNASDGSDKNNEGVVVSDFIPVVPGGKIRFSGRFAGNTKFNPYTDGRVQGISGYDENKNFLDGIGDNDLPIGYLYGQDIAGNAMNTTGGRNYENIELIIPDNVYYIYFVSTDTTLIEVYLQTDTGKHISDRVNLLEKEVESLKNSEENLDTLKIYQNNIAQLVNPYFFHREGSVKKPNFNLLHFSDIHYNEANDTFQKENMAEMTQFSQHPLIKPNLDAIIFTGDACNGLGTSDKNTMIGILEEFMNDFKAIDVPLKLNLKGNHDDNCNVLSNYLKDITGAISDQELYDIFFKDFEQEYSNISGVENKCYYYADIPDHNIRIIGVDNYTWPRITDENNKLTFNEINDYFDQNQIDWLYDTLNSTPSSYSVMVLTHGSFIDGLDFEGKMQGWDFLPNIINAFKNGTVYSHSFSDDANDGLLATSKEFDFTSRGSGKFICYLSGHIHAFSINDNPFYDDQKHIIIPCTKVQDSGPVATSAKINMFRDKQIDDMRNSFSIISIDTTNELVFLTLYGAHKDAHGKYLSKTYNFSY